MTAPAPLQKAVTLRLADSSAAQLIRDITRAVEEHGKTAVVLENLTPEEKQLLIGNLTAQLGRNVHQMETETLLGERREQTLGSLREVFDTAHEESALLVFDHADRLFETAGQDPDGDTEPTGAALTTAEYLFERIEAFEGLVIVCLDNPDFVEQASSRAAAVVQKR